MRSPGGLLCVFALLTILAGQGLRPSRLGAQVPGIPQSEDSRRLKLATVRGSPLDLEVSGDLAAMEPGSTRYVTREQLLAIPQSIFTVTRDVNFSAPAQIAGITLSELARQLASAPDSDLVVAICVDQYHAHYTRAYVTAHHPVLVLKIDGKDPAEWPKTPKLMAQTWGHS